MIQRFAIGLDILNRAFCDAAVHGGLRHGRGNNARQAGIKGFGDQIVRPKIHGFPLIGGSGLGTGGGAGQFCDPIDTGDLHGIVDFGRPHIQCPAENKGEA